MNPYDSHPFFIIKTSENNLESTDHLVHFPTHTIQLSIFKNQIFKWNRNIKGKL